MKRTHEVGIAAGVGGIAFGIAMLALPFSGEGNDKDYNQKVIACEQQLDAVPEVADTIPMSCWGYNFPQHWDSTQSPTEIALPSMTTQGQSFSIQALTYELPTANQFHDEYFITSEMHAERQTERWHEVRQWGGITAAITLAGLEALLYRDRREWSKSSQSMFAQLDAMDVRFQPGPITNDMH